MRKERVLRELREFFEEYDKRFPEWYRQRRMLARKLYEEYEMKGLPVGKYGKDFELPHFLPHIAPEHRPLRSLLELDEVTRQRIQSVGQRPDEGERVGSHLQDDATPVYLGLTELARQHLLPKHPDGLVITDYDDAVCRFPWLRRYVSRIVPINLDKYTACNAAYSMGGVFVWVKRGVVVDWPVQACFYLETNRLGQYVRIVIVAEPFSKVHLITGCAMHPRCETAVHGCISEVYVGRGAEVTFSFIHDFKPRFHIRPKVGVIVDENGTYRENYILTSAVESTQLYPTVILRGGNSRASIRSLVFGRGASDVDVGSAIIFAGEGGRGEIMSRAVVTDRANVKLRGALKSFRPDTRGHLECRALLLSDEAEAHAYPTLRSTVSGAELTHEAAVGRIAEEELLYLMSRGLSRGEATSMIARGFLDTDIPGLPPLLQAEIGRLVSMT
ncbi:MAG TPA: SufD family Fe-S cluster assembly protein, partial [Candidatus Latescibacteria bacterium]|nr:SufD family Fe-S cluster assembly protein [Candidatus Latescibacterota bacterium]